MKSRKRLILEAVLKYMTTKVLKKYQPKIIAVTGSVGKTSAKELIAYSLSGFFRIRKSEMNYNNEAGVPLTVIGSVSGGSSVLGWLEVFFRWIKLMCFFDKSYPEIMILEFGADRPGDIKYLCDLVSPEIGVLTSVGVSHLEYFKTKKAVAVEKGKLIKSLPSSGLAVYNFDDEEVRAIGEKAGSNSISYGFEEGAQIRATDVSYSYAARTSSKGGAIEVISGLSFKLNFDGKIVPIRLNHIFGDAQLYSVLASFAIASYFKLNLLELAEILKEAKPVAGRMNVIDGIKNSIIIDDTYNSAPNSVAAAVATMKKIRAKRKLAVLGDMLELGSVESDAHKEVGELVCSLMPEIFIGVGDRMITANKKCLEMGMNAENVFHFDDPMEAGKFLQQQIQEGDLVLIKGSQGMRMEKIVEEVMAEPEKASEILVRQSGFWKNAPYVKP